MPYPEEIERVEVELRKDGTLALFASMVNRFPGTSMGVTLLLPSGVVTGQLIAQADYLAEVAASMRNMFGPLGEQAASIMAGIFEEARDTIVADTREEDTQELQVDFTAPEYLHLRDGKAVQGTSFIPANGALMRIRIRDVTGFCFGEMTRSR